MPNFDINRFISKPAPETEVEVAYVPENSFTGFSIDDRIKRNIVSKGYTAPTPIQDKAIPHALSGKDVVGIANTGTGKTAAFLVPLLDKVLKNTQEQVLIVVPTRELALQIEDELVGLSKDLRVCGVTCIGGANIGPQISRLRRRNEFVIGTPGRLKDLIERRALDLSKIRTVVLDEADRMLDMGFINDIRLLMQKIPKERHTLFFSATMSPEIERLIGEFLNDPIHISVKTRETSANIEQDVVRVPAGGSKIDLLEILLRKPEFSKVLIFGRTKHGVEKLARLLSQGKFKVESIHGNKTQGQRQRALAAFKSGAVNILVATDVAARGLDISGVTHVINYELPTTYDDYVHRIGRTGRGGARGKALTFIE